MRPHSSNLRRRANGSQRVKKICICFCVVLMLLLGYLGTFVKKMRRSVAVSSKKWAVLVAGSETWINYRHQADICRAFHLMKKGGVLKEENIIIFMADDIAYNKENPRRGTIIPSPSRDDVYAGVPKDYTGKHANVNNFFAVLLGKKKDITGGSGKVIDGAADDYIFIFYSGHGDGRSGMPFGMGLDFGTFEGALIEMNRSTSYRAMLLVIDACHSGSIIHYIPKTAKVYVMTASNSTELSYALWCPNRLKRCPPSYGVCLSNWYTDAWLSLGETYDPRTVTLHQVYVDVKAQLSDQTVTQGGDGVLGDLPLSTFIGTDPKDRKIFKEVQHIPQGNRYNPIYSWAIDDESAWMEEKLEAIIDASFRTKDWTYTLFDDD